MSQPSKLTAKDVCRAVIDLSRSHREAARLLGISPTTVAKYRMMLKIHAVDRDRLQSLSNDEVEQIVQACRHGAIKNFIEPDWDHLCAEADKRGVTIALLYQEYLGSCAGDGGLASIMSESSFGRKLQKIRNNRRLSMRQQHIPGEKMFVDFSGKHLYLTSYETGRKVPVEIFVATLGASQLIYATAVPSQKIPDWIEANVRALEYFGGVPKAVVPDNLKSAVTTPRRAGRSAKINRTYLDFSEYYGTDINPARRLH